MDHPSSLAGPKIGQRFTFGFSDALIAQVGEVTLSQLHFDAKAILKAYGRLRSLAKRLGVPSPRPRLASFAYPHIASLGTQIAFPEDSEPKPYPLLSSTEEIDKLIEPQDYLACEIIQKKLAALKEIKNHFPDTPDSIGHLFEGPITTALLLVGSDFLILPYDHPKRTHKLLGFCTKSALSYARSISKHFGKQVQRNGFCDDFGGLFPPSYFKEFVLPYWERTFEGIHARARALHSELLRTEHLPFLKTLNVEYFDPGADQYLTPSLLSKQSPCKFQARILSWHIHNLSPEKLERMYEEISKYRPYLISFSMWKLEDEPKIRRLLKVARRLQKKSG